MGVYARGMSLVIILSLLILAIGLIVYFVCFGFTKATVGEVGKWMFICGLLAFLLGNGAQGCTMTAAGGSSAAHK